MSKASIITTNDAAIITVAGIEVTVAIYEGKLQVFVLDNGTFTTVNGRYPKRASDDMQSESMMLHGGA